MGDAHEAERTGDPMAGAGPLAGAEPAFFDALSADALGRKLAGGTFALDDGRRKHRRNRVFF